MWICAIGHECSDGVYFWRAYFQLRRNLQAVVNFFVRLLKTAATQLEHKIITTYEWL